MVVFVLMFFFFVGMIVAETVVVVILVVVVVFASDVCFELDMTCRSGVLLLSIWDSYFYGCFLFLPKLSLCGAQAGAKENPSDV